MIKLIIVFLLAVSVDPVKTANVNSLKKKAEYQYQKGNYNQAIDYYKILIDSMDVSDPNIKLNLAHAYVKMQDTASARSYYAEASMAENHKTQSVAYQQLGVLSKKPESLEQSLQYLKASLKADPSNQDARYDYEVVKKLIEKQKEQEQQNQDKQNKDNEEQNEEKQNQDQQDQQNQEQEGEQEQQDQEQKEQEDQQKQDQQQEENKEGEQKDQQQQEEGEEKKQDEQNKEMSTSEKLKEMNISEEKAKMILEAMKNAEIQYLQQQKRKAKERPDTGKPDW